MAVRVVSIKDAEERENVDECAADCACECDVSVQRLYAAQGIINLVERFIDTMFLGETSTYDLETVQRSCVGASLLISAAIDKK